MTRHRRSIAWFRRDLRLTDNRMLEAATRNALAWPVFVIDPALVEEHAAALGRRAWFDASAQDLDARLREHGSGLTVLHGQPEAVLRDFAQSVGADRVVASADEDPRAIGRDERVAGAVDLQLVDDQRVVAPAEVRTADGGPYAVYTPFRRALEARIDADPDSAFAPAQPLLANLSPPADDREVSLGWPAAPHDLPPAGEGAASHALRNFFRSDVGAYREDRDRPDRDATSRLSPHLRVGSLSVRAAWRAAAGAGQRAHDRGDANLRRGVASWRGELAWREFFGHVLAAHPRIASESFRAEYDAIEWATGSGADELLEAWRTGHTGYPLVDAGMRQLVAAGWMHNRARLVTASFLVKDLGLDWRRGAAVFAAHLLDADVQQNDGNWQWVAGVGMDAAPFFRIFNPTLQAKKFDPEGTYIRRWVPELEGIDDEHIHEPWKAGSQAQGYPPPIVDHAEARERTLARYRAISER
ncbi:MAG: cryptochrome/photolyase family protein [Candidatus Limnocylindria bacterium]